MPIYDDVTKLVGNTPLVRLNRVTDGAQATVAAKLEFYNPANSVKDRIGVAIVDAAEESGDLKPGGTIVEATSGNTGIALAMVGAARGYNVVLTMPESMSKERRALLRAFGAELQLVSKEAGMEGARDLAIAMEKQGIGKILDQFANPDNPAAHYRTTGPEIWRDTQGTITHFVSSMGTTGTIMGCSRYLKEQNPAIQIVGVQPTEGSQIPGIRKWPAEYVPKICDYERVDHMIYVSQQDAEETTRRMAREEGIFAGISSGGALWAALQLSKEVENAVIVSIVCDRGDRYLSTGVFPA